MVERIMLFKLVDPDTRREVAVLTRRALSQLASIGELSVGLPADAASEKSWDVSVVMRFASKTLHDETLASSAFERYLSGDMQGRYQVVKAWSFTSL